MRKPEACCKNFCFVLCGVPKHGTEPHSAGTMLEPYILAASDAPNFSCVKKVVLRTRVGGSHAAIFVDDEERESLTGNSTEETENTDIERMLRLVVFRSRA